MCFISLFRLYKDSQRRLVQFDVLVEQAEVGIELVWFPTQDLVNAEASAQS